MNVFLIYLMLHGNVTTGTQVKFTNGATRDVIKAPTGELYYLRNGRKFFLKNIIKQQL